MACGMTYFYAECNIWKMAQRNKLNRKDARASAAHFWHQFEGATALPVCLLLLVQTNKEVCWSSRGLWRKSLLVAVSFAEFHSP